MTNKFKTRSNSLSFMATAAFLHLKRKRETLQAIISIKEDAPLQYQQSKQNKLIKLGT